MQYNDSSLSAVKADIMFTVLDYTTRFQVSTLFPIFREIIGN